MAKRKSHYYVLTGPQWVTEYTQPFQVLRGKSDRELPESLGGWAVHTTPEFGWQGIRLVSIMEGT